MKRPGSLLQNNQQVIKPQLTSLIDVMTILLVFLMTSFSAEANSIVPAKDIVIPLSTSAEAPDIITTLQLSKHSLSAEGVVLASIDQIESSDSMIIPVLEAWLRNDTLLRKSEILLQVDKELPFSIVKRVMFTCSSSGRSKFTLLVRREI